MGRKKSSHEVDQLIIEIIKEIQFEKGFATMSEIKDKLFYLSEDNVFFGRAMARLLKHNKVKNAKGKGTYRVIDCSIDGEDLSKELRNIRRKMSNSPSSFIELPEIQRKAYNFYLKEISELIDKVEKFDKENKLEEINKNKG